MEVEEIQTQGCKFPRIGNGRSDIKKLGQKGEDQYLEDDEDGEVKRNGGGEGNEIGGGLGRLCGWPSSRIVRVSRASGGKDRHSKVLTSKGLRDRRVRLSVTTAIQFYDLQDRLGYDQPSKAVEWLLKAASTSIAELRPINTSFPETPKQISDEKRSRAGGTEVELLDGDTNFQQQQQQQQQNQNLSLSKSACSSASETSKGSGLSLSRSENRIKARERARGRAAEKDKKEKAENESLVNVNPISQSSFTELLTGGINSSTNVTNNPTSTNETAQQNPGDHGEQNLFNKANRQWSGALMDYFAPGVLGPSSSSRTHHSQQSGFSGPIGHLGNSPFTSVAGDYNHPELQQFSFVPDHHLVPAATAGGGSDNYNLNFTISSGSGLVGFNRGTLQSNSSPSLLPHLQRFTTPDGSNVPFFTVENHHHHHHQFPPGLDGRFQLFYGDANRHSDQKGKGKN